MLGYLQEELESAICNVASGSIAGVNIYRSNTSTDVKTSPAITVQCNDMVEDFLGGGVWHVDTRVYLLVPYEGSASLTQRNNLANSLSQVLMTGSIADAITTASNGSVSVYDVQSKGVNLNIQQDHWVIEHAYDVIAASTL